MNEAREMQESEWDLMLGEGVNEFIELLGEYGFLLLWLFSVPKSS